MLETEFESRAVVLSALLKSADVSVGRLFVLMSSGKEFTIDELSSALLLNPMACRRAVRKLVNFGAHIRATHLLEANQLGFRLIAFDGRQKIPACGEILYFDEEYDELPMP